MVPMDIGSNNHILSYIDYNHMINHHYGSVRIGEKTQWCHLKHGWESHEDPPNIQWRF